MADTKLAKEILYPAEGAVNPIDGSNIRTQEDALRQIRAMKAAPQSVHFREESSYSRERFVLSSLTNEQLEELLKDALFSKSDNIAKRLALEKLIGDGQQNTPIPEFRLQKAFRSIIDKDSAREKEVRQIIEDAFPGRNFSFLPKEIAPSKATSVTDNGNETKKQIRTDDLSTVVNDINGFIHPGFKGAYNADEGKLFRALEGWNAEQARKILKMYKDRFGIELKEDLMKSLDSMRPGHKEAEYAIALIDAPLAIEKGESGDITVAALSAKRISMAVGNKYDGTDEEAVFKELFGRTREEIELIEQYFNKNEKRGSEGLWAVLKDELSEREYSFVMAMSKGVSANGVFNQENYVDMCLQGLYCSIKGAGTYNETINMILKDIDPRWFAHLEKAFKERYNESLRLWLSGDLNQSDYDALMKKINENQKAQ